MPLLNDTLLGIIAALIAGMIWTIKRQWERSDRMIKQRDCELNRALKSLEASVEAFRNFESHEHDVHERLLERMNEGTEVQRKIMHQLELLESKITPPQ